MSGENCLFPSSRTEHEQFDSGAKTIFQLSCFANYWPFYKFRQLGNCLPPLGNQWPEENLSTQTQRLLTPDSEETDGNGRSERTAKVSRALFVDLDLPSESVASGMRLSTR